MISGENVKRRKKEQVGGGDPHTTA